MPPRDWFFVVAFSLFFCSSAFSDAPEALGFDTGPFAEANAAYAEMAGDRYFAARPMPLRVRLHISAFVYGPFYAVLVYAFLRRKNWIRAPALIYVGAMVQGVVEFFFWEYRSATPPQHPAVFWAFNLPYLVVPVLLGFRMWRPEPFAAPEARHVESTPARASW